jgi:hypothetical protein
MEHIQGVITNAGAGGTEQARRVHCLRVEEPSFRLIRGGRGDHRHRVGPQGGEHEGTAGAGRPQDA